MVWTLLDTGLRVSELCNLTPSHVLWQQKSLRVSGKGWDFRTEMAKRDELRREEMAFLENPAKIFDATRMAALREIGARIGLDYFGIDCTLDPEGNLLVFEANTTMLVHGESTVFADKQPYIARIKAAFDAMLAKRAAGKES